MILKDFRKTKIVATIGPACDSVEDIINLVNAGANVLRCNTSHLTYTQALELYKKINQASSDFNKPVAVLADLQGPKLRLGQLEKTLELEQNQILYLQEGEFQTSDAIVVNIKDFKNLTELGDLIILGDGSPVLEVIKKEDNLVEVEVLKPGQIRSKMGINLPNSKSHISSLTTQDIEHLKIAVNYVDYVALSFVDDLDDIKHLKTELDKLDSEIKIISKIERLRALDNLEGIVKLSDAVMVARGDLGIDIGLARVPFVQQDIINLANKYFKPVITATQVLESMINSSNPTRAEVTDMARAISDGTSALMLSAETSIGSFPINTVAVMSDLIITIENQINSETSNSIKEVDLIDKPKLALVKSAELLADNLDIDTLIVPTDSGNTARYAANLSDRKVIALVTNQEVARQLALEKNVISLNWDGNHGTYLPLTALKLCQDNKILSDNKAVVIWGEYKSHNQSIEENFVQLIASIYN